MGPTAQDNISAIALRVQVNFPEHQVAIPAVQYRLRTFLSTPATAVLMCFHYWDLVGLKVLVTSQNNSDTLERTNSLGTFNNLGSSEKCLSIFLDAAKPQLVGETGTSVKIEKSQFPVISGNVWLCIGFGLVFFQNLLLGKGGGPMTRF